LVNLDTWVEHIVQGSSPVATTTFSILQFEGLRFYFTHKSVITPWFLGINRLKSHL